MPKPGHWYALAALVIVLDQLSKWLALASIMPGEVIYFAPFWNWVLTFNPGAAFSLLADQPGWQRWFFTLLALAVAAWIALELRKHPEQKLLSLALTLVKVSQMVIDLGELVELEINPLWVNARGAVALDARARLTPTASAYARRNTGSIARVDGAAEKRRSKPRLWCARRFSSTRART